MNVIRYAIFHENGSMYQNPDGSTTVYLSWDDADHTLARLIRHAQRDAKDAAYRLSKPFPDRPREMDCWVGEVQVQFVNGTDNISVQRPDPSCSHCGGRGYYTGGISGKTVHCPCR